jgi:hypothetical protein
MVGMKEIDEQEIRSISELQHRIGQKLDSLGFTQDPDSWGNIVHHLAEVSYKGKRLGLDYIPKLLSLAPAEKEQTGDLVLEIQTDLEEMNHAISAMEADLIELVNFLHR